MKDTILWNHIPTESYMFLLARQYHLQDFNCVLYLNRFLDCEDTSAEMKQDLSISSQSNY